MADHVASRGLYLAIFGALMALTGVTVYVAFFDLGPLSTVAALGIAAVKATLVILYFMHARWSEGLIRIIIATSLLFLVILLAVTMSDYATREMLPFPGT